MQILEGAPVRGDMSGLTFASAFNDSPYAVMANTVDLTLMDNKADVTIGFTVLRNIFDANRQLCSWRKEESPSTKASHYARLATACLYETMLAKGSGLSFAGREPNDHPTLIEFKDNINQTQQKFFDLYGVSETQRIKKEIVKLARR